jgi:hypothetical protein
MSKSHKARPDSEWYAKLRIYAESGEWPRQFQGKVANRPAPRQKKFYDIYEKVGF